MQAFVASTGKNGIFLRLSASCTGLVEKREMRDEFLAPGEETQQAFPVGKLVVARVLSVTTKDKGAETDGANENSNSSAPIITERKSCAR